MDIRFPDPLREYVYEEQAEFRRVLAQYLSALEDNLNIDKLRVNEIVPNDPGKPGPTLPPTPGSIKDYTPFASGIVPVKLVDSLAIGGDFIGQIVFLTTDKNLYKWDGTAWTAVVNTIDLVGQVDTTQIADAAITATKIGANAVIAGKIAASAVGSTELAALAVTAGKVAANAIGTTELAALAVTASKIANATITTNQIAAAAAILGSQIAANTIGAGNIVAHSLTANEIAANTITAAQIAANTITAGQIAAGTITATELAAGAVTAAKILANTITAAQIAAGTITATEIATDAITTAKILAGQVTGVKIAAHTITAANITADTITAAEIAAGAITASELAAGSVIAGKIGALAITAAEIAANTITGAKIAANTITAANIAAHTITANEILADSITAGEIAAGAIGTTELAAAAVTAGKMSVGTLSAITADMGSITAGAIHGATVESLVGGSTAYKASAQMLLVVAGASAIDGPSSDVSLASVSIPANAMDTNGDTLRITLWGRRGDGTHSGGLIKLKYGATTLFSSTAWSKPFQVNAIITRLGPTSQQYTVIYHSVGDTFDNTLASGTTAETLSGAVLLDLVGFAGTSFSVYLDSAIVEYMGA